MHIHLDGHVEIEAALPLLALREAGIFHIGKLRTEGQVNVALRANVHLRAAKEPVYELVFYIYLGDGVDAASAATRRAEAREAVEIFALLLFGLVIHVFCGSHVCRRAEIVVADVLADDVLSRGGVVVHQMLNDGRVVQVERIGIGIVQKIAVALFDGNGVLRWSFLMLITACKNVLLCVRVLREIGISENFHTQCGQSDKQNNAG